MSTDADISIEQDLSPYIDLALEATREIDVDLVQDKGIDIEDRGIDVDLVQEIDVEDSYNYCFFFLFLIVFFYFLLLFSLIILFIYFLYYKNQVYF